MKSLPLSWATLNSARQISDKQNEISTLEYKLSLLQNNFATLLGNTESGAPNSLSIVEPAELPAAPIGSNRLLTVALSSLIGIVLAAAGAYAIEFFDPTFRTTQEVKKALQTPILGEIVTLPKDSDPLRYTELNPLSPIADLFRLVKNSLEGIDLGNSLRYIQIISAEASDGKTMVAMNLAITIAKSGKRVLLVDVDLRKTSLTQKLNLQDSRGLSNVFLGDGELSTVITSSSIENLRILTAGTILDDTSNWFTSPRMHLLLNEFEKYADVIILDGTPAIVPDAMELARKINNVIIVVRVNSSRRDMVKYAKEQLDFADVHVIGAVVNGVSYNETYYGGHYKRYAYYSRSEASAKAGNNHRNKKERIKGAMGGLIKVRLGKKDPGKEEN